MFLWNQFQELASQLGIGDLRVLLVFGELHLSQRVVLGNERGFVVGHVGNIFANGIACYVFNGLASAWPDDLAFRRYCAGVGTITK